MSKTTSRKIILMTYSLIDRWASSRFLRDLSFALKKISMLIFYSIDSSIYVVDKTATNLFWFISTSQSKTMRALIAQKTHLWDLLCELTKQVSFVATQNSQRVRITNLSLRIMFVRRCRFWRFVTVEKNAEKEMREERTKEMKEDAVFCLFCVSSTSYISVSITHQCQHQTSMSASHISDTSINSQLMMSSLLWSASHVS